MQPGVLARHAGLLGRSQKPGSRGAPRSSVDKRRATIHTQHSRMNGTVMPCSSWEERGCKVDEKNIRARSSIYMVDPRQPTLCGVPGMSALEVLYRAISSTIGLVAQR